ncbi:MAG TPA: aldolase, partial [Brevundimonas sp.]
ERGWRLVADDYCDVWASGGVVWATAPVRIAGLLEARGLGIIRSAPLPIVRIVLVVACGHASVERLPEPAIEIIAGTILPHITLDTRAASAPETLHAALKVTLGGLDVAPL